MSALLLAVLCRGRWRPGLLLAGLAALAALSPAWLLVLNATDWLPSSAGLWLPAHLLYFVGGMVLAVLQAMGARVYALAAIPLAVISYLIASTPIAGDANMSQVARWEPLAKAAFYVLIATLAVATVGAGWPRRICALAQHQANCVAGRSVLRDLPAPCHRDGDRYGVGVAVAGLHRLNADALPRDAGDDGTAGLVAASLDAAP